MAQADSGSVHVGNLPVDFQLFFTPQVLGCKRLVHFDQFKVLQLQSGTLHQTANRGNGAQPHDGRIASAVTDRLDFGQRCEAQLVGFLHGHDDGGAGRVVQARSVARRNLAGFGNEGRRKIAQVFQGNARPEVFILVKNLGRLAFFLRNFERNDFFGEIPFLRRTLHVIVAAQGDFVHLFAGNAVHLGDKFRGVPHDIGLAFVKVVGHPSGQRAVRGSGEDSGSAHQTFNELIVQRAVLQPAAPARAGNRIGNARHVFGAPGQNHIRQTRLDHGHPGNRGFHARDANPVDRNGNRRIRNPRLQGRDPGEVQRIVRLKTISKADVVNQVRTDAGPLDGLFHCNARQIHHMQIS